MPTQLDAGLYRAMAPSVLTPVLQRLDCRICPVASTRQAVGHQRQEINRRRAPIREGDAPVSRGTPNWTAAAPTAHLTCLSNCPLSTQPQQCPRTYEPYIGRWNRRCVPQRGRTRGVPRQAARRVSPRLRDTWPQSENPRVVPAAPGEHRRRELYALAPSPRAIDPGLFAQITRTNHLRTTKHRKVPVLAALICHRSHRPCP